MTRALVLLVALALVLPAAAVAQAPQTNAPPGNSAIDEYLETVPGAAGNMRPRPPSDRDNGSGSAAAGGANGGKLTPAQRARLERLGPDGKTLADAIDATAPTAPTKPVKASERTPASPASAPESETGSSPLTEVAGAFTGSDGGSGMGLALPTILLAALLAAITLVLARHRAGH